MTEKKRPVRVVALSAGKAHHKDGNPGAAANFERMMRLAEESLRHDPDIILFPEFAMIGWPYLPAEAVHELAEPVPGQGPYYTRYVDLARRSGAVVCGWIAEKETEGRLHNTSCLIGRDGGLIGLYRKTHPTPSEEGAWYFAPGTEIPVFDLGFVKVGIAICWDMAFPETCRTILVQGGDLILHPTVANDRRDICPVRCKENGLPMVISVFQDASYAVDHEGRVVADLGEGNGGYLVCDMDPHTDARSRKYGYRFRERDVMLARRNTEAYAPLVNPASRIPWTQVYTDEDGKPVPGRELARRFPKLQNLSAEPERFRG